MNLVILYNLLDCQVLVDGLEKGLVMSWGPTWHWELSERSQKWEHGGKAWLQDSAGLFDA